MNKNKNLTKVLVLLVVLVVISLTAFFTTKKRGRELEANKPRTKLFELNETNVAKYELRYAEVPVIVEKINDVWKVISPSNNYKIDQLEALANVKNFNTLNIDMAITNLDELASFGLESPSNEFIVWEGNKEHKIFVGNKTPDEERYYVKYNDEYFSVEFIYIEALKKTLDMFRDKEIFNKPIIIDSVLKVESAIRDYTNVLKKENRTNWVVEDFNEEVNVDKVYRDFETLALIKAEGFVYGENNAIERLFKIPDAVITLYIEDNTKKTYELVYDNSDNRVYAKPESGIIYEVNYDIYSAAMRDKSFYIKTEDDDKDPTQIEGADLPFYDPNMEIKDPNDNFTNDSIKLEDNIKK